MLVRLLKAARKLPAAPELDYVNHARVAKKRAWAIWYTRGANKRRPLYRDLLRATRATLGYIDAVHERPQRAGVSGIAFEGWISQVNYYKPLIERLISQTERRVVPVGNRLVIEARVAPDDIDSVSPGLSTDVRFTAFSWRSSALVVGKVDYVSADRRIDACTTEPYYLVRVAAPEHASRVVEGTTIVPGMAAEIMIRAGERTALTVRRAWREQ